MQSEELEEHRWLHQLIGNWTFQSESTKEPGQCKWQGTETVRSLGGVWIIAEGKGTMADGTIGQTVMSLGFDPARKRFTGTWMGSMLTYLWVYDGELDDKGRILTLKCDGPSMSGDGTMTKYEDIIEIVSPDERLLRGRVQGPDGLWDEFMRTTYRRSA